MGDLPLGRMTRKLVAWLALVLTLSALNFYSTYAAASGKDANILYHYSTAAADALVYGVILGLVLLIAGGRGELLALRRPSSWPVAAGLAVAVLAVSYVIIAIVLDPFLHGGREQGVVPTHWLPAHEGAYAANWFVVAVVAPVVEEITYRGLGYSLLAVRFSPTVTILAVGFLFAASHGLLQALPELATLGCGLAWLRARTGSIYPGMVVHGLFNSLALATVIVTSH